MIYLQVGHVFPHRLHLLDALLHDFAGAEHRCVVLHRLLHLQRGGGVVQWIFVVKMIKNPWWDDDAGNIVSGDAPWVWASTWGCRRRRTGCRRGWRWRPRRRWGWDFPPTENQGIVFHDLLLLIQALSVNKTPLVTLNDLENHRLEWQSLNMTLLPISNSFVSCI